MDDDVATTPLRRPLWVTSRADCRQSGLAGFFQNDLWGFHPWITSDLAIRLPGYVSVWIGTFSEQQAFDLYIREADEDFNLDEGEEDFCPLWDELGFILPHDAIRTALKHESNPVVELVGELPYIDNFAGDLLAACAELGVVKGNAILAMYGLDYFGLSGLAAGCLRFVGSYKFSRLRAL